MGVRVPPGAPTYGKHMPKPMHQVVLNVAVNDIKRRNDRIKDDFRFTRSNVDWCIKGAINEYNSCCDSYQRYAQYHEQIEAGLDALWDTVKNGISETITYYTSYCNFLSARELVTLMESVEYAVEKKFLLEIPKDFMDAMLVRKLSLSADDINRAGAVRVRQRYL